MGSPPLSRRDDRVLTPQQAAGTYLPGSTGPGGDASVKQWGFNLIGNEARTSQFKRVLSTRDRHQKLVNRHITTFERKRTGRHVQAPDPLPLDPDLGDSGIPVLREVRHPVPKGQRIVLPHRFQVTDLLASLLGRCDHGRDFVKFAIGEDVPLDEGVR